MNEINVLFKIIHDYLKSYNKHIDLNDDYKTRKRLADFGKRLIIEICDLKEHF